MGMAEQQSQPNGQTTGILPPPPLLLLYSFAGPGTQQVNLVFFTSQIRRWTRDVNELCVVDGSHAIPYHRWVRVDDH